MFFSHQFWEIAGIEKIEGQGSDEVQDEPAPHVVEGDGFGLRDDLALLVHECRTEVQDYVCKGTKKANIY